MEHGYEVKLTGLVHPKNLSFAPLVKSLVSVNWIRQSKGRIFALRLDSRLLLIISTSAFFVTFS
jgi:hypothetical protein